MERKLMIKYVKELIEETEDMEMIHLVMTLLYKAKLREEQHNKTTTKNC